MTDPTPPLFPQTEPLSMGELRAWADALGGADDDLFLDREFQLRAVRTIESLIDQGHAFRRELNNARKSIRQAHRVLEGFRESSG